jgi:hypothetical protein
LLQDKRLVNGVIFYEEYFGLCGVHETSRLNRD